MIRAGGPQRPAGSNFLRKLDPFLANLGRARSFQHVAMYNALPAPSHFPCIDCGASVTSADVWTHVCDADQLHSFRLFPFRTEIAAFDSQLTEWLATTPGRFAMWIAERDRRGLTT